MSELSQPIDIRDRGEYSVDQFPIVNDDYVDDLESILIPHGMIKDRVSKLADEISRDYDGSEDLELYVVCVLNGAMKFHSDLIYNPYFGQASAVYTLNSSRYGDRGENPQEEADIELPDKERIRESDLLIVEDIVDEGKTMDELLERFDDLDPRSVKVASLLDKIENRKVDVPIDYIGFTIPDDFVVGYGLDYEENYRDLRHIGVLKEEIYKE